MSRKQHTEIDIGSHQRFLDKFNKRHFHGTDRFQVQVVIGYARDYYVIKRDQTSRIQDFIHAFSSIMRATDKLHREGEISAYARCLLITRCIELAFLGKHYLVF